MGVSVSKVEELVVFKKAHILTLNLYNTTKNFPTEEKYNLTSQIRRASSSICANLMEGSHRNNRAEFRQFIEIARGSVGELKYHLLLCRDLNYIKNTQYNELILEVNAISKMLYNLIKSLTPTPKTHINSKG